MLTRYHQSLPHPGDARHRSGFTLIELLVVITVIGILAAILIPTIYGLFRRTDDFQRQNEIAQLEVAIENFKSDFNMYPPDMREFVDPANGLALGYFDIIPGTTQTVKGRLLQFLGKISPNHQETGPDPVQVENGVASPQERLEVWWESVGVYLVAPPSNVAAANRYPFGHETCLWFWLSQTWDNAQFPITASRDPGDATIVAAGQNQRVFFEFAPNRLHAPIGKP